MTKLPPPGNAALRSGSLATAANAEIGVPGLDGTAANAEIGVPGVEPGVPGLDTPRGWHSRGYLPHFDGREATQHVTFHLADSLPKQVVERLDRDIHQLPPEQQDAERRKRIEAWIDAGHGSCVLRDHAIAEMVQNALLFFDGQRYRLLAWVVMPNHVHVLFQPLANWTLAQIVGSWKKFTATRICLHPGSANLRIGGDHQPIWHREYWDRYIRDEGHFRQVVDYIHANPVKAGLVTRAEEWRWSSAGHTLTAANAEIGVPRLDGTAANAEIGVPGRTT